MNSLAEQLQQSDLFRDVHQDDLAALTQVLQPEHYDPQSLVFRLGDEGDTMYIILKGRVRIFTMDEQGHELTLRYYRQSQIFGEFALLDNQPRSASAEAAEPTDLLALKRDAFLTFLSTRPQVSLAMMQSLVQRARYTTTYVEEVMNWTKRLANGEYQRVLEDITDSQDNSSNQIQGLIAAFLQMVKNVKEREQRLQQELVRLQVQIDQSKRDTQVQRITRSEFFANLKAQAQEMRAQTASISPDDFREEPPTDSQKPQ